MILIVMGSKSDLKFAEKIGEKLKFFGVNFEYEVASAHKTPEKVLRIVKRENVDLFITVAGRSNALSGMIDANTVKPVIACPPYSDKFAGMDVLSSLRMPSGVAPLVVLEPENAAIAAVKILALKDENLKKKIEDYQNMKREEVSL
ncbi:MAG: 5-(carboxyamino)imidazole ribonucleotide mutase [Archaeoglobaceae archaeon]|nr:5-(carboxyamino)imidazole ribonucleotide mutase [Archaeoglobaceae archaeon]